MLDHLRKHEVDSNYKAETESRDSFDDQMVRYLCCSKFDFKMPYLLNKWMDSDQTFRETLL